MKVIDKADLNKVLSWKNGKFDFDGVDIESVGRQLTRWYNIDVKYLQRVEDLFYAQIPLDSKLTDVLKILELTGKVHFKLEGRTLIVMN